MKNNIKIVLGLVFMAVCLAGCHKKMDYDYSRWYKDPEGTAGGRPVHVMSFNLRTINLDEGTENAWEYRRPAVKAMLRDKSPLLMGCQECDFEHRRNIIADDPRYDAIGVDLHGPDEECEECAIFYLKDSIEVLEHATFYLTTTPDTPSRLPGAKHYRNCTWGRMKLKKDGREFYHFNTHLEYINLNTNPDGIALLQTEMDALRAKIRTINTDNLPIVLTADWNVEENSVIFTGIKGDGFKSARQNALIGDSYKTFNGFGQYGGQTLDHAWFKYFSGVSRFTTVRDKYAGVTYISDHYPISIILTF